jgi:hypothetical protein
MRSAGGVEFVGVLGLILDPLKERGAHAGRGSVTSAGTPRRAQDSLNHQRPFNQRDQT